MRALITGASGFVGFNLAKYLLTKGVEVIGLGRRQANFDFPYISCNLQSLDKEQFRSFMPVDVIFHCAAKVGFSGSWKDFYLTNVLATKRLLELAEEARVKYFIYTSSPSVVFNGQAIINGDENLPYASNPKSYYAQSKIQAEQLVLASNLKSIILRPHLIFGPGDTNLIPSITRALKEGKIFRFTEKKVFSDFCYIEDCVEAHWLAFQYLMSSSSRAPRVFFITQGDPFCIWDFIETIAKFCSTKLKKLVVPEWLIKTVGYFSEIKMKLGISSFGLTCTLVEHLLYDHFFCIERATKILGFKPKFCVKEALKLTFKPIA